MQCSQHVDSCLRLPEIGFAFHFSMSGTLPLALFARRHIPEDMRNSIFTSIQYIRYLRSLLSDPCPLRDSANSLAPLNPVPGFMASSFNFDLEPPE